MTQLWEQYRTPLAVMVLFVCAAIIFLTITSRLQRLADWEGKVMSCEEDEVLIWENYPVRSPDDLACAHRR